MRGEFRRADGLVIPNSLTLYAGYVLLDMAFRGATGTMYAGLCQGTFSEDLDIADLIEPTQGVNGYERIALARDATDWPEISTLNDERYIESKDLVWEADPGDFDQEITRMFLSFIPTALVGDVFALSGSLPEAVTITPSTPLNERTFRYRLYVR